MSDPYKKENDKCTEEKIKECEKKGKVCNPLKGTCVDKNGITYKNYLKTLKKPKTPPKQELKKPKTPLKQEIEKQKTPPKQELKKPKTPPKQENDKCTKEKIKECEKKSKVCNPLKGTCVDKNGITYKNYLKTLKKKTPPKQEIEKPKTPPKQEIEKPKNTTKTRK